MNEKAEHTVHRKYFEQESWRLRTQKKRDEMMESRREILENVNKTITVFNHTSDLDVRSRLEFLTSKLGEIV